MNVLGVLKESERKKERIGTAELGIVSERSRSDKNVSYWKKKLKRTIFLLGGRGIAQA